MGNTITYKSSDFIYLPKRRSYELTYSKKLNSQINFFEFSGLLNSGEIENYFLKKKDGLDTFFLKNNEIFVNFFEDKIRYFEMKNNKLCNILKESDPNFRENLDNFLDFVTDYKILDENQTANLVLIQNIMSEKNRKSYYKIDGLLKGFTKILMEKLTKKDGQRSKRRSKRRHSKN